MKNLMLFLRESNAIEDVWDELSLAYTRAAWDYLIKKKKLTVKTILKTHAILAHGKLDKENLGKFRKQPVWIGGHEAKPWYVVPELMDQWIGRANLDIETAFLKNHEIEYLIKSDHIAFEAIHPFVDGNGRLGRILMTWQRLKAGLPILVIYEKTKFTDYYPWFQ